MLPYGLSVNILLTNDDGPLAPGLHALLRALQPHGEVTVVCPAEERSGVGHAITYLTPVRAAKVELAGGGSACTITGTPADCVKFALSHLLDAPPDLIVSGINIGVNVGWDLFYSGTVAAAVEGAMNGIPSVAVSTSRANSDKMDVAAGRAVDVILALPREGPVAYNVNIPRLAGEDVPPLRLARQCRTGPPGTCTRQDGPRGRTHYWLGSADRTDRPGVDTDVGAVAEGCISVTPLRTVLTDEEALDGLGRRPPFRDPEMEDES